MNDIYWNNRIEHAKQEGEPHRVAYDVSLEQWTQIQETHRQILQRWIKSGSRLLDAGCGDGSLVGILPSQDLAYTGVDTSRVIVNYAGHQHPRRRFTYSFSLQRLPFHDDEFDLAVCRSLDGTVKDHQGFAVWRKIETELLRVAGRLLVLGYGEPDVYRVSDSLKSPEEFNCNAIMLAKGLGRLVYRPGQDGTCELYDLIVEEDQRRKGLGSRLVRELESLVQGTIYGFTRRSNVKAQAFYVSRGFSLYPAPGLYRGEDGVMFVKQRFPGDPK